MQKNDALVVPFFSNMAIHDPVASKREGRPIYRDVEVVQYRIAGERNYAPTIPAHDMWRRIDGEEVTHAMRWPEEYARFKAGQDQVASGTPLSELPFLTEAKRQELRGLKVYTAEALASLDGKNLTNLGHGGRELKDKATAYLAAASNSAGSTAMAEELADLRRRLAEMQAERSVPSVPIDDTEASEKESLKAQIAELTGARPRGNPSVDSLREMLADLTAKA